MARIVRCKRGPNNTNLCEYSDGKFRFTSRSKSGVSGVEDVSGRKKRGTRKAGKSGKRTTSQRMAGFGNVGSGVYRRSKAKYASSRSAWSDVAKKTGLKAAQVVASHTPDHYVWRLK